MITIPFDKVYTLSGRTANEMHYSYMKSNAMQMKQSFLTDEERRAAEERFSLVTDWIRHGRVVVVYDEPTKKMFYRTVNGYEFGPEYADDGAVFAMVALAVHAAGGA